MRGAHRRSRGPVSLEETREVQGVPFVPDTRPDVPVVRTATSAVAVMLANLLDLTPAFADHVGGVETLADYASFVMVTTTGEAWRVCVSPIPS